MRALLGILSIVAAATCSDAWADGAPAPPPVAARAKGPATTPAAPPTPRAATAAGATLVALPLPSPSGKPIAATTGQRIFRVPLGFARVERFYREQLGSAAKVALTVEVGAAGRTLTITSRRDSDTWSKAVAREGAVDTTIEVTPIVRLQVVDIEGRPAEPLVHFVMPPSPEVARQANSIDHLETERR